MEIVSTPLAGLLEIKGTKFYDNRGWFTEAFSLKHYREAGLTLPPFVQDNLSYSHRGVVRGLHLQHAPFAQAKLVSVLKGKVVDVVVDIRTDSATFGKWHSVILSDTANNALFVPEGFAHGFAALEDTYFFYKCSTFYNPSAEGGIRWNDADLAIDWQIENPIISAKDEALPSFRELKGKLLTSHHA
ncbi:MAG: dTDP-4-dehydrorhamnose 3,5-epimerase [Bacteroidota bacterium]